MTAEVIPFPTGGRADDTIRRTIAALMKGKGIRADVLAKAAGISRATFFNKMAGHGSQQAFKAGEVADIASALGVSVAQLYDGLGGTFTPPDTPDARPEGFEPPTFCLVVDQAGSGGKLLKFPEPDYPISEKLLAS